MSATRRRRAIDEDGLRELVDTFYARVRDDRMIGPVFNRVVRDWPEHLDRLQAFWSSVMLTSGRYKGRPLPAHVRHGDAIDAAAFERWLDLWRETTDDLFAPGPAAALQDKAGRIAESLALGIQFHSDGGKALLTAAG
jgi:hemoglobin